MCQAVDQGAYQDPQRHHLGKGDGKGLLDETGHRDHRDGHDEQHGGGALAGHRLLHQQVEQQGDEQHGRQGIVGQQGDQQHPGGHDSQQQQPPASPFFRPRASPGRHSTTQAMMTPRWGMGSARP